MSSIPENPSLDALLEGMNTLKGCWPVGPVESPSPEEYSLGDVGRRDSVVTIEELTEVEDPLKINWWDWIHGRGEPSEEIRRVLFVSNADFSERSVDDPKALRIWGYIHDNVPGSQPTTALKVRSTRRSTKNGTNPHRPQHGDSNEGGEEPPAPSNEVSAAPSQREGQSDAPVQHSDTEEAPPARQRQLRQRVKFADGRTDNVPGAQPTTAFNVRPSRRSTKNGTNPHRPQQQDSNEEGEEPPAPSDTAPSQQEGQSDAPAQHSDIEEEPPARQSQRRKRGKYADGRTDDVPSKIAARWEKAKMAIHVESHHERAGKRSREEDSSSEGAAALAPPAIGREEGAQVATPEGASRDAMDPESDDEVERAEDMRHQGTSAKVRELACRILRTSKLISDPDKSPYSQSKAERRTEKNRRRRERRKFFIFNGRRKNTPYHPNLGLILEVTMAAPCTNTRRCRERQEKAPGVKFSGLPI
ncbi:hypothetical protein EVG20_g1972 [Dentipellis fragilis]|uniref:Uncharacterized protein n=1 Tax=Dentipellis fragilis TaxID=205917 RepID=A0A4Y9ZA61_9AGAM|nr:hypothetical protein EVG20_g1972 [Dentipellis fragilis]